MTSKFLLVGVLFSIAGCDRDVPAAAPVEAVSDSTVSSLLSRGDANEAVRQAAASDPTGQALTRYVAARVSDGDGVAIGRLLARLGQGDALDETPRARFGSNVPGQSTPVQRANAQRLGYAVGAVERVFQERSSGFKDVTGRDADAMADVLRTVSPGRSVSVGGTAVRTLTVDGREVDASEMLEVFRDTVYPVDQHGELYADEVLDAYENARVRVRSASEK